MSLAKGNNLLDWGVLLPEEGERWRIWEKGGRGDERGRLIVRMGRGEGDR